MLERGEQARRTVTPLESSSADLSKQVDGAEPIRTEISIKEASCLQALENEQSQDGQKSPNVMMEEILVETQSLKHQHEP